MPKCKFEVVSDDFRKHPEYDVILPKRSSKRSAGYDIRTPETFSLKPGEKHTFWTDIKVRIDYDEDTIFGATLKVYPRSSTGIKLDCILANTVGIIDADYYGNQKNDGNIGICIKNIGDEVITYNVGDRVVQGILTPFLVTEDDDADGDRVGGIGSTGKN